MQINDSLLLPEDVLLIPVLDLPEETRNSIDCDDDHVALSKPHSRTPSTVIDSRAARLLERFREPRTVVEAVILFSREHSLDAEEVLEGAYPLVRKLLDSRFLISTEEDPERPAANGVDGELAPRIEGLEIVRAMYAMEDTELFLARTEDGQYAALKIVREPDSPAAAMLAREIEILGSLPGDLTPRLRFSGTVSGRAFAVLEWCSGVDAASAGWETRSEGPEATLRLAASIARAYAALHEAGVVHGDVHPRNVLVDGKGRVRLIDFGLAPREGPESGARAFAGGIPFYMAPEMAAAQRSGSWPTGASTLAEQFSVAAMLYEIFTGSHYADFGLERSVMLEQIANPRVRPFADRELPPWPEVERVLGGALAQDPDARFPTTRAFAEALAACQAPGQERDPGARAPSPSTGLLGAAAGILGELAVGGPVWESGVSPAPTASVNFGAAGIACLFYRVALLRGDPDLLTQAEAWLSRAERGIDDPSGFLNGENEITAESVGTASPYHSPSGLAVMRALLARTGGNTRAQAAANLRFLEASADGAVGYDLTLGRSSVLLGTTMLLEAARHSPDADRAPLRQRGEKLLEELWSYLDGLPAIHEAEIPYPGVAHGWGGFLYATLRWCRAADARLPSGVEDRLDQLARLAQPLGRGAIWPWTLPRAREPASFMPGWCNGSAGYVFLWTAAHESLGDDRWLEVAAQAGWHTAEAGERTGSLCCGFIGRAWALLNLYRHTGERAWLTRAHRIAARAPDAQYEEEYPFSLYKGRIALAALATDLESPGDAAMPFFESEGW
jgi:serine/threonine-protein kinase